MSFHPKRFRKRNVLIVLTLSFVVAAVADAGPFFRSHLEDAGELGKANVRGGTFTDDGLKGKCFTGGGPGEIIVVPLKKRYPVEVGTFSLYFRVNPSAVPDKSIQLFHALGTPRWWDRFSLSIAPKADGVFDVCFSIGEAKQGRYADRPTRGSAKLSDRPWHHLACTWENINTGRSDASFKIYLDGVLLRETKNLDLTMKNPAKEIILAGVSESAKPVEPNASGCVSLDEVTVWSEVLSPSVIGRLAGAKTVASDFADTSRCPVYKLVGKTPTIDGVFNPEEWDATQTLGPFRDFRGPTGTLAEHQTRVNLTYDDAGKLYIGWQALGASKPVGEAQKIDSTLWKEDSRELFFSPDGKKIIQFIGNAYSSVYDEISEDGGATWNRDWNGAWEYKSAPGNGLWSGELAFDPAKLGLSAVKPGDSWVFNACRNAFTPRQCESVWHKPCGNSFKDPKQMGRIRFYEKGLICNHIEIPETVVGVNRMSLFLANPFTLKDSPLAKLSVFPVTKDGPAKEGDVSAELLDAGNASGKKAFVYSVTGEGLHKALLTLGDPAEKEPAYSRPFYLDVKPPLQVEVSGNPCEGVLTAEIKGRRLRGKIASGRLSLLDGAGKNVLTQDLGPKRVQKVPFPIKDVTPGDYTLNMAFLTASGKTVAERNVPLNIPARPTCISKEAGTKNYTNPWGPLKLQGQTVKCWNREYVFDNSLFPTKLISNGEDLLTGFNKYAGRARPDADVGIVRCPNSPEYIDWYVGGCRELVRKYDVDGFYYDFSCPSCTNPKHGCGYVPEDGSGTKARKGDTTDIIGVNVMEGSDVYSNRRATNSILKHRELWRRMYNMIKEEKGEEGFINAHIDGASGAPYLSFVDTVFHSEGAACYQPAGVFPTPDEYRVIYSKEFLGLPGEQIFRTNRHRPPSDAPKMLSVSLLHREWYRPGSHGRYAWFDPKDYSEPVRVWKIFADYGIDDATWHPYWEKRSSSTPIQVSPWGKEAVLCSYWQKPTGFLAVVSNVSEKPRDVEVTLGDSAARFKTVLDTVTGEKRKAEKTQTYPLAPHSFTLLRIE